MYKGNKVKAPATQQQIKCVYVVQKKAWRVTAQLGSVNDKGTFFVVEHSIVKDYANYFDAISEVVKYMNTIYISPAKPVFSCSSPNVINVDCMSECDMELAEQQVTAREGEMP